MSANDPLVIWTIYDSPRDYPGKHVLRGWAVPGEDGALSRSLDRTVHGSLAEARAALPDGLVRLDRHPSDDPCIVETWL
jgi:hypothetical protein